MTLSTSHYQTLLALAFEEDVGTGDITSNAIFSRAVAPVTARIIAKEDGIVSGIAFAEAAFYYGDPSLRLSSRFTAGERVHADDVVLTLCGSVASILAAERVALNGLQYLSGIATLTEVYVSAVSGTDARIYDTRKTVPGWRRLAKEAVRDGGGVNHRIGLYDQFLIKENHVAACGGIGEAIAACRAYRPGVLLEVEVRDLAELKAAVAAKPDIILLDNFPLSALAEAVAYVGGRYPLEASGGVTLATVRDIAQTGVSRISVGALTHSPKALDFSLLID